MLLVIHCHLVVSRAGRRLTLIAGTLWEYVVYFIFHHQLWTSQFLASSTITPALSLNSRFCPLSLVYSKNAKNKTWLQKDLRKQEKPHSTCIPVASKIQMKTFQLSRMHSHFIPRFLVTVEGGRQPAATEKSYLSKILLRKQILIHSWSYQCDCVPLLSCFEYLSCGGVMIPEMEVVREATSHWKLEFGL